MYGLSHNGDTKGARIFRVESRTSMVAGQIGHFERQEAFERRARRESVCRFQVIQELELTRPATPVKGAPDPKYGGRKVPKAPERRPRPFTALIVHKCE